MFDFNRYVSIHKELAEQHPELKHDPSIRYTFFGDDAEEDKQGLRIGSDIKMCLLQPTGGILGDYDSSRDVWRGGFEMLVKMRGAGTTNFREREEDANRAFRVGRQIIDRLAAMSFGDACDDEDCLCVLGAFDLATVKWRKVQDKEWIGWEFAYQLGDGQVNDSDNTIWE